MFVCVFACVCVCVFVCLCVLPVSLCVACSASLVPNLCAESRIYTHNIACCILHIAYYLLFADEPGGKTLGGISGQEEEKNQKPTPQHTRQSPYLSVLGKAPTY